MKEKLNKYTRLCRNNGITLIALVITIIILLILAGISISSLTGSGLLGKAEESTRISEIKKIEEEARISYMERQMKEVADGEQATMAGVISDLREKGYTIKEIISGTNRITGVKLSTSEISMEKNSTEEITYEYEYASGTTIRYFVEVQGKNYEILFNNGEIIVSTVETDLENINKLPEITVTSSNNEIVEAQKTEDGKITITSKNEIGNVEITVKEINSNMLASCKVIVKIPVTELTIEPKQATVYIGITMKIRATLTPEDTTDKIIWSSSDESIATVSEDGVVIGKSKGEVMINATCGDKVDTCLITSTNEIDLNDYATEKELTLEDLGFTITDSGEGTNTLEVNKFGRGHSKYRYYGQGTFCAELDVTKLFGNSINLEKFSVGFLNSLNTRSQRLYNRKSYFIR